MKKIPSKSWIAAGLLLILPFLTLGQNTTIPAESKAKLHNEQPDDAYLPLPSGREITSPPSAFRNTGFTMVQVNVDQNGQNILGDAANEPSLAISPIDPDKIVIGWREFSNVNSNFRQAGYAYSADGGVTWTFPGVIEPGIFRSDPVLDADAEGTFYYNSLTSNGGIYSCKVFKSTDGGATWDDGVDAKGGDKQWMTIDRTAGPGMGNIYAYWNSYYSSCMPGSFTRSTDGAASFEDCLELPGNPYWGTLAVGNDGELYLTGSGSWGGIVVVKSTTAQFPGSIPEWDFSATVDLDGYLNASMPVNPVGLVGQAYVDVDRSTGPGRDNVYVVASVSRYSNGDPADVMFSRSTDGGENWSAPVRINDDMSVGNYQWFGTMSVATDGRIDVVWLDTRNAGTGQYSSSLYYSYSIDQGQTWSPNEQLSYTFDPHLGWPQQDKMGDYFEMESDENNAYLAWANTFNLEQDVYYSVITPEIIGISEKETIHNVLNFSAFPNPFSDEFTLNYEIASPDNVTISILNIYGEEILQLAGSVQSAGKHTLSVSMTDKSAGYYLCRIKCGLETVNLGLIKTR